MREAARNFFIRARSCDAPAVGTPVVRRRRNRRKPALKVPPTKHINRLELPGKERPELQAVGLAGPPAAR
eukprot:2991477-Prymnesium_polylepis.1